MAFGNARLAGEIANRRVSLEFSEKTLHRTENTRIGGGLRWDRRQVPNQRMGGNTGPVQVAVIHQSGEVLTEGLGFFDGDGANRSAPEPGAQRAAGPGQRPDNELGHPPSADSMPVRDVRADQRAPDAVRAGTIGQVGIQLAVKRQRQFEAEMGVGVGRNDRTHVQRHIVPEEKDGLL